MIIFLYGPDDYRREQRKKYWIGEFKKKHSGLSVGYFDFASAEDIEDFKAFARSQSIFEKKKLAVLENVFSVDDKSVKQALEPLVAQKDTTVLLSEKKKPIKALDFLLKKAFKPEEFPHLESQGWQTLIRREAKKFGVGLSEDALRFLAEIYQGNTWGLVTELEKVSSLGKSVIEKRDLEELGLETVPNYWVMLNSLKSNRISVRLWALEKMFAQNEPPPKVFNILAASWREKISAMADYDLKVKSGELEYEEVLLDIVL